MDSSDSDTIELIPIERITVINPRVRNKKIFKEIVENIAELGLKEADHGHAAGTMLTACDTPWSVVRAD